MTELPVYVVRPEFDIGGTEAACSICFTEAELLQAVKDALEKSSTRTVRVIQSKPSEAQTMVCALPQPSGSLSGGAVEIIEEPYRAIAKG